MGEGENGWAAGDGRGFGGLRGGSGVRGGLQMRSRFGAGGDGSVVKGLVWGCGGGGRFVGEREEGVGAVAALVDARVAETPGAFVAYVAFPVAGVCEGEAYVAEDAGQEAGRGVFICHAVGGRCGMFGRCVGRLFVSMADEDVGVFVVGRITSYRCLSFVALPGTVTEAVPMLTTFALSVAA